MQECPPGGRVEAREHGEEEGGPRGGLEEVLPEYTRAKGSKSLQPHPNYVPEARTLLTNRDNT